MISGLLLPSYSKGSISVEDHVRILTEALDADALSILQIPVGNGPLLILGGCGLQVPEERWSGQLAAPHLSRQALQFDQVRAAALKGPFDGDPFLEGEEARTVLFMPAVTGDTCIATIALRRADDKFSGGEVDRFTAVAGVVNMAQHLKRSLEAHRAEHGTDLLTGLGLFSDFHDSMVKELSRARRSSGAVTMGIMSVAAAEPGLENDAVVEIARAFQAQFRNFDTLDRYGSSELAFILPDLRSAEGMRVMERVTRETISSLGADAGVPDVYIGLSCYPEDGASVERLIEMAEAAMNKALEGSTPGVFRWTE